MTEQARSDAHVKLSRPSAPGQSTCRSDVCLGSGVPVRCLGMQTFDEHRVPAGATGFLNDRFGDRASGAGRRRMSRVRADRSFARPVPGRSDDRKWPGASAATVSLAASPARTTGSGRRVRRGDRQGPTRSGSSNGLGKARKAVVQAPDAWCHGNLRKSSSEQMIGAHDCRCPRTVARETDERHSSALAVDDIDESL